MWTVFYLSALYLVWVAGKHVDIMLMLEILAYNMHKLQISPLCMSSVFDVNLHAYIRGHMTYTYN